MSDDLRTARAGVDIGILLGLAYSTFVERLHDEMARAGFDDLGPTYGYVFRVLGERALMLREVAELLGMTPQGALKIVDEMTADGYVERVADPHDGRVKRVRLSARGTAALATARRFHAAFEAELRAEHGPRRGATLRAVLEELVGSDTATTFLRPL